ncbi:hypothetical protein [Rhizorhapis sp.]|uniref:hypothetical protein n=1 Tax=Rhizorhapis sp. TaxID=1968842 RepID=UPI002B46ED3C|nr:hypothetical protein [Rhizorhapis sp.]HKR16947.1 hypothetical protein [Rhizorhapis sp.]
MSDSRSKDMMQRIQIGLTGLAGVVLLVGLANIVIEKAAVDEKAAAVDGSPPMLAAPSSNAMAPDAEQRSEPLAELGVTPASPGNGDGTTQVVPDLQPNPAIRNRMDQEPGR